MIVSLPKSQMNHPARAQAPPYHPHMFFEVRNLYKPLPSFSARTRSPNLCTKTICRKLIPEAWEKGKGLVHHKTCVGDGGELERALDDVFGI